MWKRMVIVIAMLATLPLTAFAAGQAEPPASAPPKDGLIRVLIVTGGHPFKRDAFFAMFKGVPDISYKEVVHPGAQAWLDPKKSGEYDVMVWFDMWWKEFPEVAKQNLLNLLKQGKPLVILHHALNTYKDWPEADKIIGAEYYFNERNGHPVSNYTHNVKMKVQIVNPDHPITRGMQDFEIQDETYNLVEVFPNVKPLVKTEHPASMKIIGWTHTYGKSPVVFIQPGHGPKVFGNPNYRKLIMQSIRWAAGRLEPKRAACTTQSAETNIDSRRAQTKPSQ